jgi:Sigma-54 interaction domain
MRPDWTTRAYFYAFGDLYLRDRYGHSPDATAIRELLAIDGLQTFIGADHRADWVPCFVVASFFADGVPDYAVFFPLAKAHCSSSGRPRPKATEYLEGLAAGLQRLVRAEREAFLHRWRYELRERLDLDGLLEHEDATKEVIAGQIAYMAACTHHCDKSAVERVTVTLKPGLGARRVDADTIRKSVRALFDDTKCDGERERQAHEFLSAAINTVNEVYIARARGKLKGTLSTATTKRLVNAAECDCRRLLIIGDPGGGKGAAAADFHLYRMMQVAENRACRADWLKQVSDAIKDLFYLPWSNDTRGNDKALHLSLRAQLAGTQWWRWTSGRDLSSCECAKAMLSDLAPTCNPGCAFRKLYSELDTMLSDAARAASLKPSGAKTLLGYLARLDGHVEALAEAEREEQSGVSDFNMVQVPCGALSGDGQGLVSSLERLFGVAGDPGRPGLFQTCAYMGGTVFLDEVADAPVPIQDNLLVALQEGRVSRRGWETIAESVSNVAVVSATHKDLQTEVKRFSASSTVGNKLGFRPDLLTRLAQFPPVRVRPVSDYFLYGSITDGGGTMQSNRSAYRREFVGVMMGGVVKDGSERRFWERVYDCVDEYLTAMSDAGRFAESDSRARRRRLARMVTMRLFKAIKQIRRGGAEQEVEGFVFGDYLPDMLTYLVGSSE